ncbi:heterokaryon incompatibility protein-domain-containing protein [Stachybotrys elegans]|uniref:Heterokaryon incompatibility protein-domain-containing protein n=1 Tax=Stachybotrys elegans TaxID=80388 RepID=A0A8K0STM3_9HYPO|nr:heterokaryon incompatibility protein-domain-containing protein [Stachybotrys elegans]
MEDTLIGTPEAQCRARPGGPIFLSWPQAGLWPHVEIFWDGDETEVQTSQSPKPYPSLQSVKGASLVGKAYRISPQPNAVAIQKRVQDWIRNCDETHTDCRPVVQNFPARLLDLQGSGADGIQLVQGFASVEYVALSHRWGDKPPCATTTDNIADRMSSISWSELAETFQDAVVVTRQIGIRYLWIDCLCIIQNDILDWKKESVKMGDIYRGAYLTIAASLTSGDDDKFLRPSREREVYAATRLQVSFREEAIPDLWIRTIHDFRLHSFYGVQEPLAARGWTMQERVLSPRLLSYTSAVTFECTEAAVCECGNGLFPDPHYPPIHMLQGLDNKHAFLNLLKKGNIKTMYALWMDMVTIYTGRHLSFNSDRHVAILSIAKVLADKYGDEYIAGMWRGDLINSLCWYRDDSSPTIHLGPRQAPSWSWFSAQGRVFRQDAAVEAYCEVMSLDVQDGGINDSGPARGSITLRAQAVTMILHMNKTCQGR